LKLELARGEKHAEALMHIARTCDERTSEMKEQHAAALRVKDTALGKVDDENAALKVKLAELTSATSKHAHHKETIADLKTEIAALKAQAASTLTQFVTAVTAGAMEILPVRASDSRQFVEWRVGGIPPPPQFPPQFDRAWCTAVSAYSWRASVDAASGDARAAVRQHGPRSCTLRSAAPLLRGPSPPLGSGGQQQLPAYRVIVEAYGEHEWCRLGFVPSHHTHGGGAAAAVAPIPHYGIRNYGGWCIEVYASSAARIDDDMRHSGWTVVAPGDSAYATTAEGPQVPEGGAVEFAVDYAAGTCRVAFCSPAAVAGGFVEAPHAKMELRFVATAAGQESADSSDDRPIPARSVPTAADSVTALYPAVAVYRDSGNVWRFAAV
jgi:hypothetical protein